jgi:hypothetical protein
MVKAVGDHSEGKGLNLSDRLFTSWRINHDPGQVGHLGDPATVFLTLDLNFHRVVLPVRMARSVGYPTPTWQTSVINCRTMQFRGRRRARRISTPSILSWASTQITRPLGPTSLAKGNVKNPMAGPTSRTRMPELTRGARIFCGF